jgi:hypothetical protein
MNPLCIHNTIRSRVPFLIFHVLNKEGLDRGASLIQLEAVFASVVGYALSVVRSCASTGLSELQNSASNRAGFVTFILSWERLISVLRAEVVSDKANL